MSDNRIYLDNNASTQVDPQVAQAMMEVLRGPAGNAGSIHSFGQAAKRYLNRSRDTLAKYLGVKSSEIHFNSGGTEAANYLIHGFLGRNPEGHVITSDLEHPAVYNTVQRLHACGCDATFLSPGAYGAPTPKQVEEAIRPDTKLIVLMAVNNETGVKLDVEGVARVAQARRIPFIIDAVGIMGKEAFQVPKAVTAMFFSGHKFHAPQGVGFYFLRSQAKLLPIFTGGGQEAGKRPGTENLSGIVGMAEAIRCIEKALPNASERMIQLRDKFEKSIDGAEVNGEGPRTPNTTNLAFPGINGESLLMNLDLAGVAASAGSACSAGALEPSRVLLNMGYDRPRASSSLRFSLSRFTTEEEIDRAVAIINETSTKLRQMCRLR